MEFIHGIQMLPFTPISETLLSEAWVTEEYPVLAPAAATAAQGWLGFVYMDHAVRRRPSVALPFETDERRYRSTRSYPASLQGQSGRHVCAAW